MKIQKLILIIVLMNLIACSLGACTFLESQASSLPIDSKVDSTVNIRPSPTSKSINATENSLSQDEQAAILDAAWQIVNDKYYDPSFGGKDWQAIGERYRQLLPLVEDDKAFWFDLINPMLFELGASHIGALPSVLANQMEPMTFASGTLGMDVRILDGQPVVTYVAAGFPAEQAGLKPGYVIYAIDGLTLKEILAKGLQTPPYNERHQRGRAAGGMRALLFGETGEQVVIDFLDGKDQPKRASMHFATRESQHCGLLDPALPPACVEIETNRLAGGIGYLRFSGFLKPALDGLLAGIEELHDSPALIIDLRGNPGGEFPVRKAIASNLVGEPKPFMRYQTRDGLEETYLDRVTNPYVGEVVLLVDELSESSSEEFSGSLQSLGRATIIGMQTPGSCLVMTVEFLPNNALLMYPYGQSQTPDGRVLEGNGVIPDIEVALDRQQLLHGIDAQLQTAIEYLVEKLNK